jgi:hypothetical protein
VTRHDLRYSRPRAVAPGSRPLRVCRRLLLPGLLALAWPARAQDPVAAPQDTALRAVEGQVLRATAGEPDPLPGIWVVVHRVGPDWMGALDSTRSGRDGRYRLEYRPFGDASALYFVSADYAGIAYFSAPLRGALVRGEPAELYVFDTTSAPVPVRVLGRHLIVSAPRPDSRREIVEVFELANDSSVTRVSGGTQLPTFTSILPAQAGDFRAGQGDFSPGALLAEDGRMVSHAPVAPGLKQLSYSYTLPVNAFPLSLPLEHGAEVMEVLVEELAAEVRGGGLTEVTPVAIEQRTFRRFLAQQVSPNAVVTMTAPPPVSHGVSRTQLLTILIVVIAVLGLGLLTGSMLRRRGRRPDQRPFVAQPPFSEDAEAIARTIAELDEEFERRESSSEVEQSEYQSRREALKRRLAAALAARKGSA